MKRLLRTQQLLSKQQRYYQYEPMSRSIVGNPAEIPPPIHFKLYNLPDALPRTGHGFVHPTFNPYAYDAVTAYDNWEYKYYGQWWHIGSLFWNTLFLIYPVLLYIHLEQARQTALIQKDDVFKKYFNKAGNFTYDNLYTAPKATINY